MYGECVKCGINARDFWDMSWEELMVELEALKFRKENELKERALFDYRNAQLSAYAMNDPSKMPQLEEAYKFINELTKDEEAKEEKNEQALLNFINNFKLEEEEVEK